MKRLIFFTLFLIPILSYSQDGYIRNDSIDITHYDFRIGLFAESNEISCSAEIHFTTLKNDVRTLKLDLHKKDTSGKGMEIQTVFSKNQGVTFTHENDQINVRFESPLKKLDSVSIYIIYIGVPRDGLIISKNRHGKKTFFADNWPNRAHYWIPVIDHVYEKATVSWQIDAPPFYDVVANGTKTGETVLASLETRFKYEMKQPISPKIMVFGAAEFAIEEVKKVNGVPILTYVFKEEEKAGFIDYKVAAEVVDFFDDYIAPFPYTKLANVQSKTRYGGMENASCIFYYEKSVTGLNKVEELIAHEVAHQWFGDDVSEADWHHIWLSEGFATYLCVVYLEDKYGKTRMKEEIIAMKKKVNKFYTKYPDATIIDTTITNLNALLNPCTYEKAALMLHALRGKVGDEKFQQILQAYHNKYKGGNAWTKDFIKIAESISDKKLQKFFNKWLYGTGL